MIISLANLVNSRTTPNLGHLSIDDAVEVLKQRATILQVSSLPPQWHHIINACQPGLVPGLTVPGKFGPEVVIVCQSQWIRQPPNRSAYTWSEYEYLMVEVNTIWRRSRPREVNQGKRAKVPFYCGYCGNDFVDKSALGHHRQGKECPSYPYADHPDLKIFPVRGTDGNKDARAVFKTYGIPLPEVMTGRKASSVAATTSSVDTPIVSSQCMSDRIHELSSDDDDQPLIMLRHGAARGQSVSRKRTAEGAAVESRKSPPKTLKRPVFRAPAVGVHSPGRQLYVFPDPIRQASPITPSQSQGTPDGDFSSKGSPIGATSGKATPVHDSSGESSPGRHVDQQDSPVTLDRGSDSAVLSPAGEDIPPTGDGIPPAGDDIPLAGDDIPAPLSPTYVGHSSPLGGIAPPESPAPCHINSGTPLSYQSVQPVDLREQHQATAIEDATRQFPDVDPSLMPESVPEPPGLYLLVEVTDDVFPINLLQEPGMVVEVLRSLQGGGRLAKKVFSAWGAVLFDTDQKRSCSVRDLEVMEACLQAFQSKLELKIIIEIESFFNHHSSVYNFSKRVQEYNSRVEEVVTSRADYVNDTMAAYDLGVSIELEAAAWSWSSLYRSMALSPIPPCLQRPFKHSEEEFQVLVAWMLEEKRSERLKEEPPPFARALKLFSRSEYGCRAPLVCPVAGFGGDHLITRRDQIFFAMEELITSGQIYFPSMETTDVAFNTFRVVLESGVGFLELAQQYFQWRMCTFVHACCDMLQFNMEDELRQLWVANGEEVIQVDSSNFRHVLLLRENIALGYTFGSLEASGVWTLARQQLFEAAKTVAAESDIACSEKLNSLLVDSLGVDFAGLKQSRLSTEFQTSSGLYSAMLQETTCLESCEVEGRKATAPTPSTNDLAAISLPSGGKNLAAQDASGIVVSSMALE